MFYRSCWFFFCPCFEVEAARTLCASDDRESRPDATRRLVQREPGDIFFGFNQGFGSSDPLYGQELVLPRASPPRHPPTPVQSQTTRRALAGAAPKPLARAPPSAPPQLAWTTGRRHASGSRQLVAGRPARSEGQLDSCHYNFLKLDFMLKFIPLSGMIFNVKPNFTELWWHESNFPLYNSYLFTVIPFFHSMLIPRRESRRHH